MQAVPKFKNSVPGPDHACLRVFCHVWDRNCLDLSVYGTEFEVSSFTRSKFTEGGLKFKKFDPDPDHAPF